MVREPFGLRGRRSCAAAPDVGKRETPAAEGPEECRASVKIPRLHLDHIYSKSNGKKKEGETFSATSLFVPNLAPLWEQLPLLHEPGAAQRHINDLEPFTGFSR